jgi:hypothetical protein
MNIFTSNMGQAQQKEYMYGLVSNIRTVWHSDSSSRCFLNVHTKKNSLYRKGINGGSRGAI